MNFAIVIHKEKDSDYGVIVPDLPGCFSAGRTLDEALAMAKEAVELQLEGLLEEGEAIPEPRPVEYHRARRQYRDGIWAVVSLDPRELRPKRKRIVVTIPDRVLKAVDHFADAANQTRSEVVVRAVTALVEPEPRQGKSARRKRRP